MNARADRHGEQLIGFSTRLRQLLVQRGHTLVPAQLARDFTTSTIEQRATTQTFSNWLNGVQLPRKHSFHALAEWLCTTPDYLAEGVPILQFKQAPAANDEERKLLEFFRQMDDCGRRVTLAMASAAARLKSGGT